MKTPSVRYLLIFFFVFFISEFSSAQGVIIAAGGGSEGNIGQTNSWSYRLYKKLIENGDTNNDGIVSVAILTAAEPDTSFLNSYFRWIGQTLSISVKAFTYIIDSREKANLTDLTNKIDSADVIFLKGGDQGVYYDLWNETSVETAIRHVISRNGAIGGTSAGAMSLAQYAFAGGKDLVSADVLADSKTGYLDDDSELPGKSGIHSDFLSLISTVVIDTHEGERGRLGRTIGILAKAIDDSKNDSLFAIGIDRKTGICIVNGIAEVIGEEAVFFIRPTEKSILKRDAGRPLIYTNLKVDHLTEGWKFDLNQVNAIVEEAPSGTVELFPTGEVILTLPGIDSISVNGTVENEKIKFSENVAIYPSAYKLSTNSGNTLLSTGFTNSGNSSNRGDKQEGLLRGLYDQENALGVLMFSGGWISQQKTATGKLNWYFFNPSGKETASILIDTRSATYKTPGKYTSYYAGSAKNVSFVGLTVHVLAESLKPDRNYYFDRISGNLDGGIFTSVQNRSELKSVTFELGEPFPNPFNPSFSVQITANQDGYINVEIVDLLGRKVGFGSKLVKAGTNHFSWALETHPSGLYFVRVSNQFQSEIKKVMLLK